MSDGPLPAPPRLIASLAVHSQRVFRLSCVFFLLCAVGSLVLFWPILIKEDFEAYLQCDGPQHGRLHMLRELRKVQACSLGRVPSCFAELSAMFSAQKWAEMREMQRNYATDLQESTETGMGRTQRIAIGLLGFALFVVIVALYGSQPASPARASARHVLKFTALDAEKKASSVEEREEVSEQVLEMQSKVTKIQTKLEHLQSALDSCGSAGEECAHPLQCCHGVQCCADGTQCCGSGNCCAANDVCCHGGCCSQGSVCCGNGLCGLPGSKCEDGIVLAPPIHTSPHAQEAIDGAKKALEEIESAASKAEDWVDTHPGKQGLQLQTPKPPQPPQPPQPLQAK
ncbi:unnamed protein product [Symbiodinium sp. CCMP2592]|nr:unnamed protein product [Symbiodinium sp. CCMP2592]